VCVQETNKKALGKKNHPHDDKVAVDYIAYTTMPFSGVRAASLRLKNGFNGKACSMLTFEPAFKPDAVPKIVATTNHRSLRDRHWVDTVWFENITPTSAKACVAVAKNTIPRTVAQKSLT